MRHLLSSLLVLLGLFAASHGLAATVETDARGIRIDGQYSLLRGGSLQWFRLPPGEWRDRLERFKAAGLNTVDLYVPWSLIEPEPGQFNFSSPNLGEFLALCRELGLYVYLRPGPYITNEIDGGGIPYWLTATSGKRAIAADGIANLRTADPDYLSAVRRYFKALNAYVRPYLASQGGPIILYAIENEYNWFEPFFNLEKIFRDQGHFERSWDQHFSPAPYLSALRDMAREDGIDVPITTCPGDGLVSA
ncbi:MAG: beta-galactosidase, partial [Pseudomonas sp.]